MRLMLSLKNNSARKPKELWTENPNGTPITYYQVGDERDEARFVIEQVLELQREENIKLGDVAVLYRTNPQSRIFEEMLIKSGLPYVMVGGQSSMIAKSKIFCLSACSL